MLEYAKVYGTYSNEIFGDGSTGMLYVGMVAAIAVFALLTVLFSVLKKPVAVIVFSILSFVVFLVQNWDYTDRGIVPTESYEWGIGHTIFFIAFFLVIAGAVWMLVNKILIKKQNKLPNE